MFSNSQISTTPRRAAIARRFGSAQQPVDDPRCAAYARPHGDGLVGTVLFTGAAFHAPVFLNDPGFPVFNHKHFVGANDGAHPAPGTFFRVEIQGHHIAEIYQSVHRIINFEKSQKRIPAAAIPIWTGRAVFISF